MRNRGIDFLVIGAMKSGTTSLFNYMKGHPSLYLPAQKETNFFVSRDKFDRGIDWYMQTYFSGANECKLWGEVSPQYMGYTHAPARIHKAFPEMKLIAILRNPIDRAYSHYRMSVRRDQEKRSFRQVIIDQQNAQLELPGGDIEDDSRYVLSFGLYGKALAHYLRYFDKEQILILFQDNLRNDPSGVMADLFSFLMVDDTYNPPNLDQEYFVGGPRRFPRLDNWLRRQEPLKRAVRKALMSDKLATHLWWWYSQISVKPHAEHGPSPDERMYLIEVFKDDVALLERLFSIRSPWQEFEQRESLEPT